MKYGIIGDLHLEFYSNYAIKKLIDKINSYDVDVVLNAGDTSPNPKMCSEFARSMKNYYFSVLGNHDFYGHKLSPAYREDAAFDLVGSTLWTSFDNQNPLVMEDARKCIADFYNIHSMNNDYEYTIPSEIVELNKLSEDFIFQSKRKIVLTHFPPSNQSSRPEHRGDYLNQYFCNSLEERILDSDKKLWVCGHTHYNAEYYIGDCLVVSNSLGYPGENYGSVDEYEMKVVEV